MRLRTVLGITGGLFVAGVAVGYVANKRGIPQDQVPRWLVKETTRKVLHLIDAVQDLLPDQPPVPVSEALGQEPPGDRP
jgi:hypothetical protein